MPLYEYWCHKCCRKVTLYLPFSSQTIPVCPDCQSDKLQRLFSTFSLHRTDRDIYENILNDSQLTKAMLKNDPKALAEWNRRMSRGEKVAPEYEDMVETMKRGKMPGEKANKPKNKEK